MQAENPLGEYLRARRDSLTPEDVGLVVDHRRRRVAGLRREEVAALAGISSDYYLRLEQGRERHPSEQVLHALARALGMSPSAEEHLQRLVRPLPERGLDTGSGPWARRRLAAFVDALAEPAFVHDRILDVVVSNAGARLLSAVFRPGVNVVRAAFGDAGLRGLYRDADEMATRMVSYLRAQAATPPNDPRLPAFVARMSAEFPAFARLWALSDFGAPSSGVNRLRHPVVGDLELNYERLCFAGTDYPVLIVYHPEPGSVGALARLLAGPAPATTG